MAQRPGDLTVEDVERYGAKGLPLTEDGVQRCAGILDEWARKRAQEARRATKPATHAG